MKLLHLSDLHFGTEEDKIFDALKCALEEQSPNHIIVSGDFTQVASSREFAKAKTFIQSLPAPVFCVPGNHDIPRYDLFERFLSPYRKYKHFIDENLCPYFSNDQVVIAGINSARRVLPHWNWANGAISGTQILNIRGIYDQYDPDNTKRRICVFHHPVHHALNAPMDAVVFGAKNAMNALNDMKVDLVLTGHVHHASVTTIGDIDHRTLYLSASTALSSRRRKQQNGFNEIEINPDSMSIKIHAHDGTGFKIIESYTQSIPAKK